MVQKISPAKQAVMKQLGGFAKDSHAASLASGLMKSCKGDPDQLHSRIAQANAVVKATIKQGVSSFYAAEYAKVFTDPEQALATREKLMAEFELDQALTSRQSAKMADCIVFSVAKKQDPDLVERVAKLASASLKEGVAFTVVADVVYYNPADVAPEKFAQRCVSTSVKQNKPLDVSEVGLRSKLTEAVSS
ncbi:MAG: hypothetical protein ABH983_02410 [Candidatus Micrarchaeota archaeon]